MFKKVALVFGAVALLLALASCSKYGDLKDSMDKFTKSADAFIADNGKATDVKSSTQAILTYAKTINDNAKRWGPVFAKNSDVLGNAPSDFTEDLKKSREAFTQVGGKIAAEFEKVNTAYGSEKEVQDAFGVLYDGLKNAIAGEVSAAAKFETDMNAATEPKAMAKVVGEYTDISRKALETFDNYLPLYPELSRSANKPQALQQSITDLGGVNTKIIAGFTKVDTFKDDADLKKALESRYANLKAGIDSMLAGTEKFIASSDKATDAKTTAAAIEAFAEVNQSAQKSVQREVRLFPELQSKGIEGLPASLGGPLKKLGELNEKVRAGLTKADTYKDDEAVKKALSKLNGGL